MLMNRKYNNFLKGLLHKKQKYRMTGHQALSDPWLRSDEMDGSRRDTRQHSRVDTLNMRR